HRPCPRCGGTDPRRGAAQRSAGKAGA
ncbi:zinc finger domain-containing protein, partial [Acinetobacter baumannii]